MPVPHHPQSKEFLPYTQSKSPLFQFKTITPFPITTGPAKKCVSCKLEYVVCVLGCMHALSVLRHVCTCTGVCTSIFAPVCICLGVCKLVFASVCIAYSWDGVCMHTQTKGRCACVRSLVRVAGA